MYKREFYNNIVQQLYKQKVIIIFGARRVGKTTLSKQILSDENLKGKKTVYFNAEFLEVSRVFSIPDPVQLKLAIGNANLVVIDEAQHIENIGFILKVLVDTFPDIQVIATGSSSFDLNNKIGEPLVGRAKYFHLNPLSILEIAKNYIEKLSWIEKMLIYGGYPSIINLDAKEAQIELSTLVSGYLYKDILAFEAIKHSDKIVKLLQFLAFQIGNEVSYNEIGTNLGMDRSTVERYIDLLEKCFVLFRLKPFSRNLRKEITKNNKIFFYDLGIRNSLIQNFNSLELRNDVGNLWENFCIIERLKRNSFVQHIPNVYFWRHYNGQEVDYIEEYAGALHSYEFKYNEKAKIKSPKIFLDNYYDDIQVINKQNIFKEFIAVTDIDV